MAALWHDGSKTAAQKFVLRDCSFDGVHGFVLGRHHYDAQFYLLDCTFSPAMKDKPLVRYTYREAAKIAELDKMNRWGERTYYWHCHRVGIGEETSVAFRSAKQCPFAEGRRQCDTN